MKRFLMSCILLIVFSASTARAAFTTSGDVIPTDPSNWTSSATGYVGKTGTGTLTVDGGSNLLSYNGYLGYDSGSSGTVTVTGTSSTWTNNAGGLFVGYNGTGTLNIIDGGVVSNRYQQGDFGGVIGTNPGSTGVVTVDGVGSMWINVYGLFVGYNGSGTLNITGGGSVVNGQQQSTYSGAAMIGSTGVVTVAGTGSSWTDGSDLFVLGTLNITGNGAVSNFNDYIGYHSVSGSTSTVTMDGSNSTWTNNGSLYVGYTNTGSVTQTGGTISVAGTLYLGNESVSGTYNLNGGRLVANSIANGSGTGAFNFGGGTLQASGSFSTGLPMTLTGTSGNANVNTNGYTVTLSGVLFGTGGLNKTGAGTLMLTAAETYSGDTTVNGGTLAITGGIGDGGTTLIDVQSGAAILSTTNINKSDLDIVTASGATFDVAGGTHVVGDISGDGITKVDAGASLTVASLRQGTLIIGGAGATAVPEPSTFALLGMSAFGFLAWVCRRSCKAI